MRPHWPGELARQVGVNALKQTGELMALNSFVQPLDERLKRCAARVGPQRQLKDIDATPAGLTPADDVLADLHALRQLHLAQAGFGPEDVQLLKEQLVFLTVKRASHPGAAANATEQDQSEEDLWENAIIDFERARHQTREVGVASPIASSPRRCRSDPTAPHPCPRRHEWAFIIRRPAGCITVPGAEVQRLGQMRSPCTVPTSYEMPNHG